MSYSAMERSPIQICMHGNFHSHRKTLDISVAMSKVPEPTSVLQAVQASPVHLVPRRSDATSIITHNDFSHDQHIQLHTVSSLEGA